MPRTDQPTNAPKLRGRHVPALCNVLGTLLLLAVIALSAPLAVPRFMGYEIYNVVSGSMEPNIPMDSVVYVQQVDPANVKVDDVIAFWRQENIVVHRVLVNRQTMGELATKGDANNAEDPDPVPYDAVIGTVAYHIPMAGKFMALYSSTVGKVYLFLALACGLMLNMLASRMRADQRRRIKQALSAGAGEGAAVAGAAGEGAAATADEAQAVEPAQSARRRRSRLRTVAIALLALIFLGSAGVVGFVSYERSQSDRIYTDASSRYTQDAGDDQGKETVAPIVIDFDDLCGTNKDVVGWIYCKGTPINYPVLQGETNNTYLRTDYTKEYNINGSIFVDCDNRPGFVDANTIVYGHHMNHGAMFATLDQWAEQDYYEEHPVMWLLTPEQDYQVVLVSGHHTSAYSDMYDLYHEHDDNFARYLQEAIDQSDFKPIEDATVNPDRNYIMLTTCAYIFDNARYVLHGKLVPVQSAGGVPFK